MAETLEGFPFWRLVFDDSGRQTDPPESSLISDLKDAHLTDFFVFSHGWNNSPTHALKFYRGLFGEMRKLIDSGSFAAKRDATIGVAGVFWPSMFFPDEMPDAAGGAASLGDSSDPFTELRKVFKDAAQQDALNELERLLSERKRGDAAIKDFLGKLKLFAESTTENRPESDVTDDVELRGVTETEEDWREVLNVLADGEQINDGQGGAAGIGDAFDRLWSGAKGALRVTSYWLMKDRAGKVGREGLGPLIGRINVPLPDLRIHLIGHSFGARLVSFALAGLPGDLSGAKSPVKSLYLLQGAFSHFAFADKLPFDSRRSGELKGMAARVDGPLVTTHSQKDSAVGRAYPLASFLARQDASAAHADRWGAMGNNGAQEVGANTVALGKAGTAYAFGAHKWTNLDGNSIIVNGGPPSGAHSDIIHPHTAWAALAAAGLR